MEKRHSSMQKNSQQLMQTPWPHGGSPFPREMCRVTSFGRVQYGKGTEYSGESWQTWSQSNDQSRSKMISHVDSMYPGYEVMKTVLDLCVLLSQNSYASWEKHQTDSSWGPFYKIPDHYFSKLSNSSKTRKVQETVTVERNLRRNES